MDAPSKAMEIKAVVAAACATVVAVLGWTGIMVIILVICIALDYITGTCAARAHGEWSSEQARQGLWHKLGEIFALLVAMLCDIALHVILYKTSLPIGDVAHNGWFTLLVCFWYIITELGSILENVARLGAPIPQALIKGIGKLKKKVDNVEVIKDEEKEEEEK